MTLKINTQEDDRRQLNVTVEVSEERLGKAMKKTARKMARQVRVPGFRPGKAPYSVIKSYLGEGYIRGETLNEIVPAIAQEALDQIEAEPYGRISLEEVADVEGEPVTIKMVIPLEPTIVLHDYRSIRKEIEPVEITEDAVDEAIENLLERHATFETVEKAAEWGDTVVLSGKGHLGDDESDVYFNEDAFPVVLDKELLFPSTPFGENIVGMKAGDEKSFSFEFPEDYLDDEEVAGQVIHFVIALSEVQEKIMPELTDEFAQELDDNLDSAEQLRTEMEDGLKQQAEQQFNDDLINGWIDELAENVEELVYPQGAVDQEIDGMINNLRHQINQIGLDWDAYLSTREAGEEALREDFEEEALDRLERSLVFQQFVRQEQIKLEEDEVSAEIESRLSDLTSEDEDFKNRFQEYLEGIGNITLRNELIMDKIYNRIQAIYAGEAPDLPDPEPENTEPSAAETSATDTSTVETATEETN